MLYVNSDRAISRRRVCFESALDPGGMHTYTH